MPRDLAANVLDRVLLEDAYSHIALDVALSRASLSPRDRGLATQLVYGTLTWLPAIDRLLEEISRSPLKKTDARVLDRLRLGAYQILFLDRVPARAAIHEAVEQTKAIAPQQAGFVNACLRRLSELESPRWWRPEDAQRKPVRYLSHRYALPSFVTNRLLQQLGFERAEQECAALAAAPPPLWARWRGTSRAIEDEQLGALLTEGASAVLPEAALLTHGLSSPAVREALERGELAIQDLGSQLVGALCGDVRGLSALDACAGLGGKSLHLLDDGAASITSVEPQPGKLQLLESLADPERLHTFGGTVQAYVEAHPEARFDLVLVDAPCTGLGVLRRHPEGRLRKQESEITTLATLQAEILRCAATCVAPGGALVYSVCTFTREEGPRQIERFLHDHPDFTLEPLSALAPDPTHRADWSQVIEEPGYLRTWPGVHDADAFFAARLRRTADIADASGVTPA